MTKKLSLLFFICILSALNINAEVYEGSCGDNVNYSLDTSTGLLSITGTGAMNNYNYDYSVPWYSNRSYVKTVEISNGVASIGSYAFFNCSGLTSVTIPNSVTSIGNEAFWGCTGLTSVTIPNSVTSIEFGAFGDCSGLTSVTIPNSVTSIGNYAFTRCSGLTSITIPNSVTSIGNWTFSGCSGLTSVTIPNSVTSIGESAFSGCSGLTSITIPNSVTSIGNGAFEYCSGLTSVHITDIAAWCKISFNYQDSNPLCYAHHLFMDGKEITDLVIPNSVTSIAFCAFYGCSGLTSVTIPNSVTSIGYGAFDRCSGLTSVHITDIAAWCNISFLGTLSKPLHLYINGKEIKDLNIPNTVTSIRDGAFKNCSGLTSVTIGNSVTSIGSSAFSGCSGLTQVTLNSNDIASKSYSSSSTLGSIFGGQVNEYVLGDDVTSIGSYAFYGRSGLTSVTIGNSVTSIGKYAFNGCTNLTTISIGSNIQSIGERAFANIDKLNKFTCYAGAVPTADRTTFENSYINYVDLCVPSASVNEYNSKSPWREFGTINALSELSQCATPTIEYVDGKLSFSCETEGVKYVYNFSTPSESDEDGKGINMPNKLQVSVYAKKDGFENSDVATKEIDLGTSGLRGDVNNDGTVNMPDAMFIVNKILNGKFPDEK